MNTELRSIALTDLRLSHTPAQDERRNHFDKAKLAELADTIKAHGLVHPILVRPLANGAMSLRDRFEIVAGERRYLAAKQAKLNEIPCTVRELTDEQAIEVQLIENLGREDLHPLAEAEGYEALQKRGHTVEQMADHVGKSKGTIYARMKLLALSTEARKAFYAGSLSASTALLVARIPREQMQKEALKHVTQKRYDGSFMSVRDAADYIQRTFMLRLDQAPFPTGDAGLVPAAGPCGSCPKRTGNQPGLFDDVKSADVCTDPTCFQAKRDANTARLVAKAEASGKEVISGAEAKRIAPHGVGNRDLKGYVNLDAICYDDSKYRKYRQIVGKSIEPVYLQDLDTGELVQVAREADVKAALKKKGISPRGTRSSVPSGEAQARRVQRREQLYREALYAQVLERLPPKLDRQLLEWLAESAFTRMSSDYQRPVIKVLGWTDKDDKPMDPYKVREKMLVENLQAFTDQGLIEFLFHTIFGDELVVRPYGSRKPDRLLATAKRLRINVEKIRKETAPAPKKKKAAKK